MDAQFWWFYDAVAAVVVLLLMIFAAKKGAVKSLMSLAGFLIAAVIAVSISGGLGTSMQQSMIQNENAKKISKNLDNYRFENEVSLYLSTEFNRNVRADNLKKIYESDKPYGEQIYKYINNINGKKVAGEEAFYAILNRCYADLTRDIVSEELNEYAAETAAREVLENPESFNELIPLLMDRETKTPVGNFIAENYTADAYAEILSLVCLIAILIGIAALSFLLTKGLGNDSYERQSLVSHAVGAIAGIFKGAIVVFAIAVCVRLNVILGNDSMMFFNHEAIDKTYVFKYFYDFVVDKF